MSPELGGRPGDERAFFGNIIGAIAKVTGILSPIIPGASIVSRVATTLAGGGRGDPRFTPTGIVQLPAFVPGRGKCDPGFSPDPFGSGCIPQCPEGTVPDPQGTGICVSPKSPFGQRRLQGDVFGGAVMGRFGAALEPAVRNTVTRVCPRGSVLGLDGWCYDKLRNSDRMWPRGTRPLLTGGEMRCIRIASRAANKLRTKEKQLRSMGMLPALPKPRKQKALPAGHHVHVEHN